MNSRELALVSTATVFGALASAFAVRFYSSNGNSRKQFSKINSVPDCDVSKKCSSQSPFDPSKRKEYLSWDDYFMAIALLSAERSKDPNRQVGACLVSQNGIILGIGYNGFPRGCSDDDLPWAKKSKSGDPLETKYPYVCHAEVNAILNTNHASAVGQRLYVTMFPCNECAKIIIQSGVSEVIYFIQKNNSDMACIASHKLLSMAGIKVSFACCFVEAPTEVYFGQSTSFVSNCVLAGTDNQSMTPSLTCYGNTCLKLFMVHINKYSNPTWIICSSFGISVHLTFHNLFLIVLVLPMAGQKTPTPDGPNFDQVPRALDNDFSAVHLSSLSITCSYKIKPCYNLYVAFSLTDGWNLSPRKTIYHEEFLDASYNYPGDTSMVVYFTISVRRNKYGCVVSSRSTALTRSER